MSDKNLKRLRKIELMEMLLAQSKRVEELEHEVEELSAKLESRAIILEDSGDLATACLQVNGIFEAAQKAADQYLDNIRIVCDRKTAEAELEAVRILQNARDTVASQRRALREKGGWTDEGQEAS